MAPHLEWPAGSGEMAGRIRAHDWAATPLGPIQDWPQNLRTAVDLTLDSPSAAILLWGPQDTQVYNDRWRMLMGGKHPSGLGQPTHAYIGPHVPMRPPSASIGPPPIAAVSCTMPPFFRTYLHRLNFIWAVLELVGLCLSF